MTASNPSTSMASLTHFMPLQVTDCCTPRQLLPGAYLIALCRALLLEVCITSPAAFVPALADATVDNPLFSAALARQRPAFSAMAAAATSADALSASDEQLLRLFMSICCHKWENLVPLGSELLKQGALLPQLLGCIRHVCV